MIRADTKLNSQPRKQTHKRQPFIALIDEDLLNDVRNITANQRCSIAHFLRESIMRSVNNYKKLNSNI